MNRRYSWMLSLILILLGSLSSSSSSVMALTSEQRASPAALSFYASPNTPPNFASFAGSWIAHGSSLNFASSGLATFDARTYAWCGPGVAQPCDSNDARGIIHPGGHEQVQFSRVAGNTAYGTIITSNLHTPGLAVMVVLQTDNTLLYTSQTPIALLCGPTAPAGTCGA